MTEKWAWLNEDTKTFLSRGYTDHDPKERYWEIAQRAEELNGIKGFAEAFYEDIAYGDVSLSSPVIANFGAGRGLPISCNGSYLADDTEAILLKVAEIGVMTKHGAGTSAYLGDIRPRGAPISGGGVTDGPARFAELLETTINVVSQSNVRRGACAAYLPVDHPDIMEFLEFREEGSFVHRLSIGVCISDEWMESLLAGDPEKKKVWLRIIRKRFETGYPYLFFTDAANRGKPQWYKDKGYDIHASNLCVHGDTKILTSNGYEKISSLVDSVVSVWNGEEWSKTTVRRTAKNQKLVRVTTNFGHELECTPEHKFYVQETRSSGGHAISNGPVYEVRAKNLIPGQKLIKFDLPVIEGSDELDKAYTNGFFTGDGCQFEGKNIIYLYGEKKKLLPFLDQDCSWNEEVNNNRMVAHNVKGLQPKFFVPGANYSIKSRIDWLAGLLDADGTIAKDGPSQTLQIASVEREFLRELQLMLQTLGCDSKISKMRSAGTYRLPANDGTGENKDYECREINRILISGAGILSLLSLGLDCKRLEITNHVPNRNASRFVQILSVEEVDGLHDTFCFTEEKRHMGMFNGILTGQCSEIMLPSNPDESFVCCLASMNWLNYDRWKDSGAVGRMVQFLDAVMEEYIQKTANIPSMKAAHDFAKNHRAIGIGDLGWHSYLQSKMIPFEGLEAQLLGMEIERTITEQAEAASREMAKTHGESPVTKGYGIRHATLRAVAPTTSSSFILGQVSPSIEPLSDNYFVKDLQKGKFAYRNPYLKALLAEKGKDTPEVWKDILIHGGSVQHLGFLSQREKDVFKTFGEISQKEILIQASQRQKYIDQGQSLNIMLDPDTSVKDASQLLIEAWKLGLKALYYNRGTNPAQAKVRDIFSCAACEA